MNNNQSLCHSKWDCKYHVVWIPKYRKKTLYGQIRKDLGNVIRALARQRNVRCWRGIFVAIIFMCIWQYRPNIRSRML